MHGIIIPLTLDSVDTDWCCCRVHGFRTQPMELMASKSTMWVGKQMVNWVPK
jgi:hypothetical protein